MTLSSILHVTEILAAVAYALLFLRLVTRGHVLWMPAFTLYCAAMVVDMIWHPLAIGKAIWIQPTLLTLRTVAVIEALGLVMDRTNMGFTRSVLLGLGFAGAATATRVMGFYPAGDLAGWYRTVTQIVHVGLAAACIGGNCYQLFCRWHVKWDALWLPHFRLLSLYMVMRGAVSFFYVLPKGAWSQHATVRIMFLAGVCAWASAWLFYDGRALRAARFKCFNS